jgi:hypothetical protein
MTRSAKIAVFAAATLALAACNDPSEVDRVAQAPAPSPVHVPTPSAAANGSPQVRLEADMVLSSKVKDALPDPARRIEVAAADGVVTLYGTVETPADKDRIALAAMEVEGVRSVVNNLVVIRSS